MFIGELHVTIEKTEDIYMKQIILFLSALIISLVFFSCDSMMKKGFEFFYYPSRNVYYDVTNARYLYSLNAGKTWDSLNARMDEEPSTLGPHQVIYSLTPEVWRDNEEHIKQYNGHPVAITEYDSNNAANDLVGERKIIKAPVTTTPVKPEKKPGFLKRLFGKKN